jgi:DNA-binding NarL/FixJ family response regulator
MLRILTIDDHEIVREGIKRIFEAGTAEFGEARSGHEALTLASDQDWDIAVLDISLRGRNGLEVLKELKQVRPRLPVLILSMHAEEQYAVRAFKAGAAGYITKESSRDELHKAILKIVRGGHYVSPDFSERIVAGLSTGSDKAPHEVLSDREMEVLCLIGSGKTVGEIANKLALSDKTISTYRRRILDKMSMNTSAELTHYAIQNKLVD